MTTARMKHGRPHFVSLWMITMISEVGNQVQYLMLMHQIHEIMHLSREVCRLRFINRYWLGQPRMWPVLSQISLFWSNAAAFEMLNNFCNSFCPFTFFFPLSEASRPNLLCITWKKEGWCKSSRDQVIWAWLRANPGQEKADWWSFDLWFFTRMPPQSYSKAANITVVDHKGQTWWCLFAIHQHSCFPLVDEHGRPENLSHGSDMSCGVAAEGGYIGFFCLLPS